MTSIRHLTRKSINHKSTNILSLFYDGFFERDLTRLDCQIYGAKQNSLTQWTEFKDYNPPNLHEIGEQMFTFGNNLTFDFIICNDRTKQYEQAQKISHTFHIPILIVDHATYTEQLNPAHITQLTDLHAAGIVACNQPAMDVWKSDTLINYGIEIPEPKKKDIDILIAGNFIPTDMDGINNLKTSLNAVVIGNNKDISQQPEYYLEWIDYFQRAKVFVNLSTRTDLSRELITAMSCNCAIVSNNTSLLNCILKNNINCLLIDSIDSIPEKCQLFLNNESLCEKVRKTNLQFIKENFSINQFIEGWSKVFNNMKKQILTL